jgi:hypothetical protein
MASGEFDEYDLALPDKLSEAQFYTENIPTGDYILGDVTQMLRLFDENTLNDKKYRFFSTDEDVVVVVKFIGDAIGDANLDYADLKVKFVGNMFAFWRHDEDGLTHYGMATMVPTVEEAIKKTMELLYDIPKATKAFKAPATWDELMERQSTLLISVVAVRKEFERRGYVTTMQPEASRFMVSNGDAKIPLVVVHKFVIDLMLDDDLVHYVIAKETQWTALFDMVAKQIGQPDMA